MIMIKPALKSTQKAFLAAMRSLDLAAGFQRRIEDAALDIETAASAEGMDVQVNIEAPKPMERMLVLARNSRLGREQEKRLATIADQKLRHRDWRNS